MFKKSKKQDWFSGKDNKKRLKKYNQPVLKMSVTLYIFSFQQKSIFFNLANQKISINQKVLNK